LAKAQSAIPSAPEPVPTRGPKWPPAVKDNTVFAHVLFNQFEGRTNGSDNELRWDAEGWVGTDMNRLWIKSEGFAGNGTVSDGDHEVLYDRPIPHTRYFDAQAGVRADVDGSWDLFLTQRWVVQPQAELNFYSKDDPARQTGSGLSDIDAGIRLRYEITRKISPYVGWAYEGKYGNSAVNSRESGGATSNSNFVFGLRVWY
jgi:copper resistance protein B